MPAFGVTHDDQELWDLVAFLERLPELDNASFEKIVTSEAHEHNPHGGVAEPESGHHEDGGVVEPNRR